LFGEDFVLDLPRYFTLFGFNIYYYGLFITAGFAVATLYLIKRRELFGLTKDHILDILIIAIPCGLIGARIYYMIFNFDKFFGPGQWENILRFRDGGLAVYGGIIASGLVFILYSRYKKIPLGSLLDAAGFGLFIGQAIGRWGNFINREAFGVETTLPWRMGLKVGDVTRYYHPAFLYEALWNVVGLLIIHIFSKKSKTKYPGQYFLFYVAWYGLGRFMIEGLRVDSLMIPGTELRASQWLAAISFFVAVGLLVYYHVRGKEITSVYGDDAEDAEEMDSTKELSKLDGASEDELLDEDDDDTDVAAEDVDGDDGNDGDDDDGDDGDDDDDDDGDDGDDEEELAKLDGASDNDGDDDDSDGDDSDGDEEDLAKPDGASDDDDDDDTGELAELDGVSNDGNNEDIEDENTKPEKDEIKEKESIFKIKIRRKK